MDGGTMTAFESVVEEAAIAWLAELGWQHVAKTLREPDGELRRNVQRTTGEYVCQQG
jgi:uncharacterized membrane protein